MTQTEALLLFGISPFYSPEELQDRWRYLIKQHHPDLGHNPEYFKRLIVAHDVLKNYRKIYSAQQEWSDFVRRQHIPQESHESTFPWGMFIGLSSSSLTLIGLLSSPYSLRVCQQLFDIQLRLSAASGQILHILTQKPPTGL